MDKMKATNRQTGRQAGIRKVAARQTDRKHLMAQ